MGYNQTHPQTYPKYFNSCPVVSKLSENPSTAPFTPSFLESHLFEFSASTDQQFVFLVGTCDENQSRAQPNNNKKTLHTKKIRTCSILKLLRSLSFGSKSQLTTFLTERTHDGSFSNGIWNSDAPPDQETTIQSSKHRLRSTARDVFKKRRDMAFVIVCERDPNDAYH